MSAWRALFVLAGVLILAGGLPHPRGEMQQMLTDPNWVITHVLVTVGFVALLAGLWSFGRGRELPKATRTWLGLALVGTGLQLIELIVHTVAVVDAQNLVGGQPTPVLSTHLALAVALYPVFGITMTGFIIAAARDRVLGSPWIAPLGVIGAVAHALSAPLTVGFGIPWAWILFPMMMLIALWAAIVALLPGRAGAAHAEPRPSPI